MQEQIEISGQNLADLKRQVEDNKVWYHTIDLAPGLTTPGLVDLRGVAEKVLPDDLSGKRALDVGTFDGFWAFEMEKRGAEVVALDVESIDRAQWPPANRKRLEATAREFEVNLGVGFSIAAKALGSTVEKVICDVNDLDRKAIDGPVDLVFSGAILLHLRDPVKALELMHGVLKPGGELRQMEPYSLWFSLLSKRRPVARFQPMETNFNWWVPNIAALRAWSRAAGFTQVERLAVVRPPSQQKLRQPYALMRSTSATGE